MRFFFALVMIAACAGAGWWWWTTTPQYAVEQVKVAIKTHDLEKFNQFVDLDTASARMVDDFLTRPMRRAMGGSVLGEVIVTGLATIVRPHLAKGIRHEIVSYVETGKFKADQAADEESSAGGMSLSAADEHFGFRRHSLKGIKSTEIDGGVARVVLLLHNQRYNQDLTLDVNMRKTDGHWQVIELSNFPQFCARLAELAADKNAAQEEQNADQEKANGI